MNAGMKVGPNQRVLVVDDDSVSCQLIGEILAAEGYAADGVTSGDDALERLGRDDYDLIVSDVFMPGMSGTAFAARAHRVQPDVPILLITAFPNMMTEVDAVALGARILAKPFLPDDLIRRVNELLTNGSAARCRMHGDSQ